MVDHDGLRLARDRAVETSGRVGRGDGQDALLELTAADLGLGVVEPGDELVGQLAATVDDPGADVVGEPADVELAADAARLGEPLLDGVTDAIRGEDRLGQAVAAGSLAGDDRVDRGT